MVLKNKFESSRRASLNDAWKRKHIITIAKMLYNQNYKCSKCGINFGENGGNKKESMTIQHLGIPDDFNNMVLWCRSCNSKDGAKRNLSPKTGRKRGFICNNETRKRMSKAARKRVVSNETKNKMSETRKKLIKEGKIIPYYTKINMK